MTVLGDLKTYLGPDTTSQWDDAELESAIEAETRAQTRVLKAAVVAVPVEDRPAQGYGDVYEALLRRCARNLAMRKIPLGLAVFNGGVESTRVGRDPEVRRLEAPHRKAVVG